MPLHGLFTRKRCFFIIPAMLITSGLFSQDSLKIFRNDLPPPAVKDIDKNYAKYSITSIKKTSEINGLYFFKVTLQKKTRLVNLTYNADGKLLNADKSRIFEFDGFEKPVERNMENKSEPLQHIH